MWKKVTPDKISFVEEGMQIVGVVTSFSHLDLGVNSYAMTTEDGDKITFLGTVVLDKILPLYVDKTIRITYKGEDKTSGGTKVKLFEVDVFEEDEAEVEVAPAKARKAR